VVQMAGEWWRLAVPLPAEFDNTTGETIGLSLARVVARGLSESAASVEVVYDAQAAAQILGAKVHRQRHPVRRAVRKATTSSASTEWWVRSHQEEREGETEATTAQSDKERRIEGNEMADEGAKHGARMSAEGKRASLPMDIEEAYGVYKKNGGQGRPELQWRIHKPEHWREPRRLHPRMEELLKEFPGEILTTVPLHLEMWHPTLQACGRCEKKEEATTRFRCPCFRATWREAVHLQGRKWWVHDGSELRISSRYPTSSTTIAAEGEGTHDWAAVPREGSEQHAALERVEIRSWARVVRQFQNMTDKA
jgi:hypothetical protein